MDKDYGNNIEMMHLQITRANVGDDGIMRWQGVMSDIDKDRFDERTSLQLFDEWITHINKSDAAATWLPKATVPFLGIAHYQKFDGEGEAGATEWVKRDGTVFKAGGIFYDTAVGRALYEAISNELAMIQRGVVVEAPIRISSAWWDTCHAHGDFVFVRESATDKCPMCEAGVSDKVYLGGQLDHFAATRVPVNPRTNIELEEKSMAKITKKSDAASIVGAELAEMLDGKNRAMVGRSDTVEDDVGLVIKAEDEEADMDEAETVKAKTKKAKPKVEVDQAMDDEEMIDEEDDGTQVAKAKTKKVEVEVEVGGDDEEEDDTEGDMEMKAKTKKGKVPPAFLKNQFKKEDDTEDEDEEDMKEKSFYGEMEVAEPMVDPLAGITSFKEAEHITKQGEACEFIAKQKRIWNQVVEQTMKSPYTTDKLQMVIDSTNDMLDNLTNYQGDSTDMVAKADLDELDEFEQDDFEAIFEDQEDNTMEDVTVKSAADLGEQVELILQSGAAREDMYLRVQSAMEDYAVALKSEIDEATEPTEVTELAEMVDEAFGETKTQMSQVAQSLATLTEQMGLFMAKLDQNVVQRAAVETEAPQQPEAQQPVQRSVTSGVPPLTAGIPLPTMPNPAGLQQSLSTNNKPSSLRAAIRRSVGMNQ